MRRRLVFVTQQVDPAHPALAATVPKLLALAERVDELAVLADGAVPGALPAGCRVHTFRAPTQAGRGVRFLRALALELGRGRGGSTAVVAHMCPIYAVLAAPLARPLRVPVLLWFVQASPTRTLVAAERLATAVLSVEARSFPLASRKLRAIGHGIDLGEFPCREAPREGSPFFALALGRYSPAKGYPQVLRALALARADGLDARLQVRGPELTGPERRHRAELDALVGELGLAGAVELGGPVPRVEVPRLLWEADVLVDNMVPVAADKVVFEAAASCVPALASSPVFDGLLPAELRFPREDPAGLAARLVALAARSPAERAALGATLRERVAAGHSVDSWADGVVAAAFGDAR